MSIFDVILPTRGRPRTIVSSIASVLDQTVADLTLHVVGDGCDARTEEVVRSFTDPRVRFRRFPKGEGFGYEHRNTVLRETSAPMIAYMTDDDLLFPDHLERSLAALEGRRLALVAMSSAQVRYPDDLDLHFFAFDWKLGGFSRLLARWFIGSANLVHRRSLFERIGYWDGRLIRFGDREFYQRACDSGEPSAFLSDVTLLRFFAAQWDRRYPRLETPPQQRYLDRLRDPQWRAEVRRKAAIPGRPASERLAQLRDFLAFGARSGPRFARYLAARAFRPADSGA